MSDLLSFRPNIEPNLKVYISCIMYVSSYFLTKLVDAVIGKKSKKSNRLLVSCEFYNRGSLEDNRIYIYISSQGALETQRCHHCDKHNSYRPYNVIIQSCVWRLRARARARMRKLLDSTIIHVYKLPLHKRVRLPCRA